MPKQFAATTAGICNAALMHLAVNKPIVTITDATPEARACNAFYDQVRDEILQDFAWPFAKRVVALGPVVGGTSTVPVTIDWQYSYRLPADCISPRRLLPGTRVDTSATRIPFAIGADATGGLLFTDQAHQDATSTTPELPQLEYTAAVTTESAFPADFAQAFAFKLAFYMAPVLTAGDPNKLGARAYQLYQQTVAGAQDTAWNERQPDIPADAELIRFR